MVHQSATQRRTPNPRLCFTSVCQQPPRFSINNSMRLPIINGLIRRRLLVNFRVNEGVMSRFLPPPFRPKLHNGYAIAGICLIRLEQIRPNWLPSFCGLSSENAAHRIAVLWDDPSGETREGVFVPRRDTGSRLTILQADASFLASIIWLISMSPILALKSPCLFDLAMGRCPLSFLGKRRMHCLSPLVSIRWRNHPTISRAVVWAIPSLEIVAV